MRSASPVNLWTAGLDSNQRCVLRHGFTVRHLRHSVHLPTKSNLMEEKTNMVAHGRIELPILG